MSDRQTTSSQGESSSRAHCGRPVAYTEDVLLRHDGFRRLCHARDLLREISEPPMTVEAIARELHISPFHFIRQFEGVFGVTPHQFRIQARLDAAKYLLAAGQHSVTDVCMEVGFSSLGSFSALFSRRDVFGALWAAYQHYGDPTATLVDVTVAPSAGASPAAAAGRRPARRRKTGGGKRRSRPRSR